MKKITLVTNGDDWEGLYIDGKITVQDHTLSVRDVLKVLNCDVERVECDYDWLCDQGYLPTDLEAVVRVG